MFHPAYLGFFNRDELARHRISVRKPLDPTVVRTIIGDVAPNSAEIVLGGLDVVVLHPDHVEVRDSVRSREAVDIIVRVARQTGCEIARLDTGSTQGPDQFLDDFLWMEQVRQSRTRKT